MWATCYTDASHSPRHGGAWAVWLRSDAGRIVRSGRCPKYVKDGSAAELAAIYAGVYLCVHAWPKVCGIHVRSDSEAALRLASADARPPRNRALRKLQRKLRALVAEHGIELSLRWVKGHQSPSAGTAAWLNGNCDRRARHKRRAAAARGRGAQGGQHPTPSASEA